MSVSKTPSQQQSMPVSYLDKKLISTPPPVPGLSYIQCNGVWISMVVATETGAELCIPIITITPNTDPIKRAVDRTLLNAICEAICQRYTKQDGSIVLTYEKYALFKDDSIILKGDINDLRKEFAQVLVSYMNIDRVSWVPTKIHKNDDSKLHDSGSFIVKEFRTSKN